MSVHSKEWHQWRLRGRLGCRNRLVKEKEMPRLLLHCTNQDRWNPDSSIKMSVKAGHQLQGQYGSAYQITD